jgi:hypothetical protein
MIDKLASLFGIALTLFILGLASFGALQSCSERWMAQDRAADRPALPVFQKD